MAIGADKSLFIGLGIRVFLDFPKVGYPHRQTGGDKRQTDPLGRGQSKPDATGGITAPKFDDKAGNAVKEKVDPQAFAFGDVFLRQNQ